MNKTELEQYLKRLQLDKAVLLDACSGGNTDYIMLLGCNEFAISTTKRLLNNYED